MARTWRELIGLGASWLESRSVPDAETAAELLAARLLKVSRGFLAGYLDETPGERYVEALRRGMARLAKGEPIQYVLGEWDFRSLTLKCDRRALIPRPETEQLVERVLKSEAARRPEPFVVDVGTGSGCIILSLAKEMKGGVFLGIDISPDAVALAGENARMCALDGKVRFAVADGLDDFDEPGMIDILVSNPPYIPSAECALLDPRIRDFEPVTALDGGVKGLDFYERFAGDAINVLKPGGEVFFEIGHDQGEAVRSLLFDAGFEDIKVERDWAGHDRYVSAKLP